MDIVSPAVSRYLLSHCPPPDDVLDALDAETRATAPDMSSSHYEGELLSMMTRLTGARKIVKVGVFTGYSTLCMARAMPADGQLIACEINDQWAQVAQRYWGKAGVADRIELRIGPAAQTLRALPSAPVIDLGYLGADKANHRLYYEELVPRLRPGGVIVVGDALRGGFVADETCQAPDVIAVRELNDAIGRDDRVDSIVVPAGDGATIVRKR